MAIQQRIEQRGKVRITTRETVSDETIRIEKSEPDTKKKGSNAPAASQK